MRKPLLELLLSYLNQLNQGIAGVGFYDHVVADIEKQKEAIQSQHREFKEQMENKEHTSKLTVYEQKALSQNEFNFRKTIEEMDHGIATLIRQKWTQSITTALWLMEEAKLLVEFWLSPHFNLEDLGQENVTTELVPWKKFDKADYVGKLSMLITGMDTLIQDIMQDSDFNSIEVKDGEKFQYDVYSRLGMIQRLLQRDLEDIETNGQPNLHKFDVPDIEEPEVPKEAPVPEDITPEEVKAEEVAPEEVKAEEVTN